MSLDAVGLDPMVLRLAGVATLVLLVALAGRLWRARDGHLARTEDRVDPVHLERLGLPTSPVGLVGVLLGAVTCAPCESAKRVLAEVAAARPAFSWRAVEAVDHPELVSAHRVLRVPTLLVIGPGGRLIARTSGVPRADELLELIDATAPSGRRRVRVRRAPRPAPRPAVTMPSSRA